MSDPSERRNWLLRQLPQSSWLQFGRKFRLVELAKGEILHRQGEAIDHVYFPEGALIGLISAMPAGDSVQTAMVGWDGALGAFEACGTRRTSFLAEVKVDGAAWRIRAEDYRAMFEACEPLRIAAHKYVEILLTEARQFVACNALHAVDARLCRSVLEALERSRDGCALPVTQDALAEMLGVQRTTVTAAIGELQAQQVLRSRRGVIEVLDPAALEEGACCCRETLQLARAEIHAAGEKVCES